MMELIKRGRRPWHLTPFSRELWSDIFSDRFWPEWARFEGEGWRPALDLHEKEGNYHLTAELPGLSKDDVNVTIDGNILTISGGKEAETEEKGATYYLKESSRGSFSRSLRLPGEIDPDKIEATFKDGLLTLVIAPKGEGRVKKIEVK